MSLKQEKLNFKAWEDRIAFKRKQWLKRIAEMEPKKVKGKKDG